MSLADWTTRFFVGRDAGDDPATAAPATGTRALRDEPTLMPLPASLIGGRVGNYLITKRLGAGGVGEVFKAVDVMLKREVAIKVLRDDLAADPSFLARFRNEAQLQARLNHPNVARVFAFLEQADKPLMVMEYVAGVSLEDFVRSGGPVPVARALHILRRVLEGVAHAHGQGIVHRDLKPANIMLADDGEIKVMDFGIARALDSREQLTRVGHVAGTAKAMSPEQIRGQGADARSDVYSLGIVLYTMLAGQPPFDDADDLALMRAQLEQSPPPLRGRVPGLPLGADLAVMRALEKDPAARFQTARDFADAIDGCLADLGDAPGEVLVVTDDETQSQTIVNPAAHGGPAPSTSNEPGDADATVAPSRTGVWLAAGAGAVAVGAVATAVAWMWGQLAEPTSDPSVRSTRPANPAAAVAPTVAARDHAASARAEPSPGRPASPTPHLGPTAAAAAMPAAPSLHSDSQAPRPAAAGSAVRTLVVTRQAVAGRSGGERAALQPGERIQLSVVTSHDAHVYCYLQDETRGIQRFFPNRFQPSSIVKANAPLQLPGAMRFEIVANAQKLPETVACFASARDLDGALPRAAVGADFARLPMASLDELRRAWSSAAGDAYVQSTYAITFE